MVDAKGKKPTQGSELLEREKPTRNMLRLCIRCKAEMTSGDWDALLLDMPGEVKRWFAFIGPGEGATHYDH